MLQSKLSLIDPVVHVTNGHLELLLLWSEQGPKLRINRLVHLFFKDGRGIGRWGWRSSCDGINCPTKLLVLIS